MTPTLGRAHAMLRVGLLVATDAVALVVAALAAHACWTAIAPRPAPWQLWQLLATVPLFTVAYALAGLYPGHAVTAVQMLRSTCRQTSLVLLAIVSTAHVLGLSDPVGRGTLALWWAMAVVAVPLTRSRVVWLASSWPWWREPVLLVGDADRLGIVAESLALSRHVGYRPVAVCLTTGPTRLPDAWRDLAVLPTLDVAGAARQLGVRTVVIASAPGHAERWAVELSDHVHRVVSMLAVEDGYVEPVAVRYLGQSVGIEIRNRLLTRRARLAKRTMDLLLAAVGLVLAAPAMVIAALAIVLRDPGPVFHVQVREGRGGRPFRMWKLRTMYRDAEERLVEHLHRDVQAREEWEREFKLTGDPRVLPGVGRFLRRWSLDECPQLWHVLRGDMSLVGPRALPAYHLQAFGPTFRVRRQRVRPGITGMWQVMSRGRGAIRTQEALDAYYISNWSIWMDVFLLAKTAQAVVSGRGAR